MPQKDRLNFVITARAKSKIKGAIRAHQKVAANEGKEIFERKRVLKGGFWEIFCNKVGMASESRFPEAAQGSLKGKKSFERGKEF